LKAAAEAVAPVSFHFCFLFQGELPAAMHSDAGLQHGPTFTAITSALAILKLISPLPSSSSSFSSV
jgi:hypothetical protein